MCDLGRWRFLRRSARMVHSGCDEVAGCNSDWIVHCSDRRSMSAKASLGQCMFTLPAASWRWAKGSAEPFPTTAISCSSGAVIHKRCARGRAPS